MARVLFAHGHLLAFDEKQRAIGKPYPPLGTLFAAAHARALGHDVALFDPMLDEDVGGFAGGLARAFPGARPDLVVLYDDGFNWFTKMCLSKMRQAARALIATARAHGLPVVVAGHDAADDPAAYLVPAPGATGPTDGVADFVIAGEGEITLGELLGAFDRAGGDVEKAREAALDSGIAGLVVRQRGMLRRTPPRPLLTDLDALPDPAWDLVDVDRYRAFWRRRHGYFSLNVVTTRGCPYRCNWCAKPVYGSTYHTRSPARVLGEIANLRARHAPDHLWFCDDILGLKPSWLEAFARGAQAAGTPLPFLCQTRADLMSEVTVDALARAGAREVWLGAESGAQGVLDAMEKGITVEETRTAARRLRARGVRVGLFLQFGYPGEGWREIQQTRALVRELLPDDIGVSVSYPLPGTKYHERVARGLGDKRNWSDSSDLDPLVAGRPSPAFYRALSSLVHAELHTLRGARELLALVRSPVGPAPPPPRPLPPLPSLPFALGPRLRRIAQVRHAGRWLLDRVRLEAERRSAPPAPPAP